MSEYIFGGFAHAVFSKRETGIVGKNTGDGSPEAFVHNPGSDFTRTRKLDFATTIRCLLAMKSGSLKKELLAIFQYHPDTATTSAFYQQHKKIYGIRRDIETFFKRTKSLLQLGKEFQGRSFDMLISHTTIVFARYIVLSWQHRQQGDEMSLGGLFLVMCDELAELDWVVAFNQLLEILNGVAETANKRVAKFIKCQLSQWMAALPNYIKVYLPISICES